MTGDEQFADGLARALAAERAREQLREDTEAALVPLPEPWEPAGTPERAAPGAVPGYALGGVVAAPASGSDAVPLQLGDCLYGHILWTWHYIASRYGSGGDAR